MNERPIPWYKNHILLLIILIPLADRKSVV